MRLLPFRIGEGDLGPRLAQPKAQLPEQALALTHAQRDAVLLSDPDRQRFAIPQIAAQPGLPRRLAKSRADLFQLLLIQAPGPPSSLSLAQTYQALLLATANPILHRPRRVAQQPGHLGAGHSLGYQQHTVEAVVVAGILGASDLILQSEDDAVRVGYAQWSHALRRTHPVYYTQVLMTLCLALTRVLFDGLPAPLLLVSEGQINVVALYGLAGASSAQVEVEVGGVRSAPVSLPVSAAGPGVFTLTQAGTGQGAVLNQDNSVNGAANPAPAGSVVQIFATGGGVTSPSAVDGGIAPTPPRLHQLTETVQADIDGLNASVLFAGAPPGLVFGVVQVNAEVPAAGGAVPLQLTIGGVASQTVTIAVS